MRVKDILQEGYEILPQIDRDRYQKRDGLEGPIMTRSGKVIYYDPKAGNYYDPDTDMYLTYDEYKALDSGMAEDKKSIRDKEYEDYLAKRKALQDIQTNPKLNDPETADAVAKRKEKLKKEFPQFMPEAGEALTEEQFDEKAGKKDACYHKVKSRYKVWPSAYASGALVQCRKVGAKNWGNSKKK